MHYKQNTEYNAVKTGKKYLEYALAFYITFPSIAYYFNYCLKIFGFPGVASWLVSIALAVMSVVLFSRLFLSKPLHAISMNAVLLVASFISVVCFGNSFYFLNGADLTLATLINGNIGMLLFRFVPIFVLLILGVDVDESLKFGYCLGAVSVMAQLSVFALTTTTGRFPISEDYMSFAYFGICPLLVTVYRRPATFLSKMLSIAAFALIAVSGCRGALVTVCLFLGFYLIARVLSSSDGSRLRSVAAIAAILFLLANLDSVLLRILSILNGIGFTSRSLEALAHGSSSFLAGSGRDVLYSVALDKISFTGAGLFGDRRIMDSIGANALGGASIAEGAYVHNWILELLLDFGWFFGAIAVAAVIALCARAVSSYVRNPSVESAIICAFSFSLIFGRYLVSASLLISSEFAISILLLYWVVRHPDVHSYTEKD